MDYYAVFYQGKCVAKIVWDGQGVYVCPFLYDEIVKDERNEVPVINGDEPIYGGEDANE